jgi:alcohol dehydrogenase, propanol-preferring
MKAMLLNEVSDLKTNTSPLEFATIAIPELGPDELLLKISTCGVCRTELDEIEGRTPPPQFPVIPGHQVVGRVAEVRNSSSRFKIGERVGVAWIYSSCGICKFCLSGDENLCPEFRATGRDVHGGYAQFMVIPEKSAFPIPEVFSDSEAAPLLCAGAIGYRSLRLTNLKNGNSLGLTGFGGSGHLVLKMAKYLYPASEVFVFARNPNERQFAIELGAAWAGDTAEKAPLKLEAIIDTTPVWKPVIEALNNLSPGGRLVINAIRKEDADKDYLLNMDYSQHLWMEKEIKSVANVSRRDVAEFLDLAANMNIRPEYRDYPLVDANQALLELKSGEIRGAKVLRIE